MVKLKKILLLLAVYALVAAIAVSGTLAFLTDRDSEANVFTVGKVSIKLSETFEQGATLIPGVGIEKKPVITNTGKNDAWVWLTFSIPSALDNYVQGTEQGSNENVIHWNPKGATTEGYVTAERVIAAIDSGFLSDATLTADYINTNKMHWNVFNSLGEGKNAYQEEINGVAYNTYVLLYNKALEPGETTLPNIEKVFLDARVDIDPNGDWYFVDDGVASKIAWNSNTNGSPIIYVSAYAMQMEEFATVEEAFSAYQAQWGNDGSEYAEPATAVSSADELTAVVAAGGSVVLTDDITVTETMNITEKTSIDLNGHELVVSVLEAKEDATISNGTLVHGESTYPALSVSNGTLTLNDVKIVCEEPCNVITSGSAQAAEYSALEVWSGSCVLNDCDIVANCTEMRYSNSIFAIGIHSGELTMNGGSITVSSVGSTKVRYNYEGAIFAGSASDKVINLSDVTMTVADTADFLFAWGGNTVVNTTDAAGTWTADKVDQRNGGTYEINYK
jgi:predicted ribosomally synthesized peptide with SipW-like signal peptide